MKSFKSYLAENDVNWTDPNHESEHKEVGFQLKHPVGYHVKKVLNKLKDPKDFHSAIKSGTSRTLSSDEVKKLSNTQARNASEPKHFDQLKQDSVKKNRVRQSFKSGNVQRPVVIHHDHGMHLLGGSHRATYAAAHKIPVQAHVIDMRTKKKPSLIKSILNKNKPKT